MQYVAPSAPLGVGGVLDNWLRLFRSSLHACWPIALLAAVAGALVQLTVTPPVPTPNLPPYQSILQSLAALSGPRTLLTDLALALIAVLVYAALLTQQTAVMRGERTLAFGTALANGLRRTPQMILGWLVLIVIIGALAVPFGVGAAILWQFLHTPAGVLLAALGLLALVLVMVYVSVRLQLWQAVMFAENRSGPASLGRSWDLVKGHWWRVTGIGFVSGILIGILTWAASAVIGLLVGFAGLHGGTPYGLVRRIQLIGAVAQVMRLLTMPLLTAVWLAIYQDLLLRREGGDLAARAEALSGR
jgi:hypothetical protein